MSRVERHEAARPPHTKRLLAGAGAVWKVTVKTTPDAEDAVTGLLERVLRASVASYTDFETGQITVQGFPKTIPRNARSRIHAGLKKIKDCGTPVRAGRISMLPLRPQDWAESWKRHFRPIEIGSALLIKPSWSRRRPRRGQQLITLDPGLSFGTGQHPTTAFCLHELVRRRKQGRPQPFLDIGTGSGILAIAAARLGYQPIVALDSDSDALAVARENARQNDVLQQIHFLHQDLAQLPIVPATPSALVCANLISTLLLEERHRIISQLQPDGVLVLAGILRSEFVQTVEAYELRGLELINTRTQNEWTSGALRRIRRVSRRERTASRPRLAARPKA